MSCSPRSIVFHTFLFLCIYKIFDHIFGVRLGRARNVLLFGGSCVPSKTRGVRFADMSMEILLDSQSGNRSKRPSWKSGSSSAATLLTNRMLWISLRSTALTTLIAFVMIILHHPRPSRQSDSLPWEPTRPQDKAYFWERIEAPWPPYGHGPNSTSFIHDNPVPFLKVWNFLVQMMKSCAVAKVLSPQEQIILLRG